MNEILVLYYSRFGATEAIAREVCLGIDTVTAATARLRTVPALSAVTAISDIKPPENGPPYVIAKDLHECGGLVMGSPTRFGNMAAPLKYFIDSTGTEWAKGTFEQINLQEFLHRHQPCMVAKKQPYLQWRFHFLHHGMFLVGIPFTESALTSTTTGGSPLWSEPMLPGIAMPTISPTKNEKLQEHSVHELPA